MLIVCLFAKIHDVGLSDVYLQDINKIKDKYKQVSTGHFYKTKCMIKIPHDFSKYNYLSTALKDSFVLTKSKKSMASKLD